MSETTIALVALALPLLAAAIIPLFRLVGAQAYAHTPAVIAFGTSAILSVFLLANVIGAGPTAYESEPYRWFGAQNLDVSFSITVDTLSVVMLATVTFISTWIAIFSSSYMHGESGYDRYFAIMSLFVFCMCLLVLANNFLLLVAGWEGVGLCSYLLVGYYYAKPSAAAAARKAFLVTRLGDAAFLLGIFLIWQAGGYELNFRQLFENLQKNPPSSAVMTTACLLLFCGAVGKSAQFPLYVWLPDAMEGPTPVSALIHAATMVTAGVYLLARTMPIFVMSPAAQAVVTLIGAITAFLAAFIALAQTDLKRVLAYSTVSQLGFMFMALGCAGAITPSLAIAAAIFHLFTHAFFKALLFLGSGSVMHAMGNVIDMRKFGGLRKVMPWTHLTFLIGALALAGIPPLAGFWSKDQVLDVLHQAGDQAKFSWVYNLAFAIAIVTAGMTAFYTFRAYFLTFWGEERIPEEAHGHAHESPAMMVIPLVILAIGAALAGLIVEPFNHGFSGFLNDSISSVRANENFRTMTNLPVHEHPHLNLSIAALGTLAAVLGIGIALAIYRKGGTVPVPAYIEPVRALSQQKLMVDEIYQAAVVVPAEVTATLARQFDSLLDSIARFLSYIPRFLAALVRPLQNGLVQFYALGTVLGLAVLLALLAVRATR